MAQAKGKYWLAGHSDSEITYDEVKELATISETDFGVVSDLTATATEINNMCDASSRLVTLDSTPVSITAATHGERIMLFHKADGVVCTLPAATGTGVKYTFLIKTTVTSNNYDIKVDSADATMDGVAMMAQDGGGTLVCFETAATSDSVRLDGTTQGGIIGDRIELIDVGTDLWHVNVWSSATGTEASPFEALVS
jgi:hypothetical protein